MEGSKNRFQASNKGNLAHSWGMGHNGVCEHSLRMPVNSFGSGVLYILMYNLSGPLIPIFSSGVLADVLLM